MSILSNRSWQVFIVRTGVFSTLVCTLALVAGGVWVGARLTLNPKSVAWLQPYLPPPSSALAESAYAPLTLDRIQEEVAAEGRSAGEPVVMVAADEATSPQHREAASLLLPIVEAKSGCREAPCEAIVALRLYQPDGTFDRFGDPLYYLQREVELEGPPESLAIAPLVEGNPRLAASNRPLAFHSLQRFEAHAPRTGIWLNLVGEYPFGDTTVSYGQVLHFNPGRLHLSPLVQWSSPTGKLPVWQDFTGAGDPELVVDRTVGLEPNYEIYRVTSRHFLLDPIYLEPIALAEPALDIDAYREALLLARSGLWSAAHARLEPLAQQRQQQGQPWPEDAQAQLDTIALHARLLSAHADTQWASPDQATIAALLDGRWSQALRQLETWDNWPNDIFPAIASNPMRLWRRVETSLRLLPEERSARVWAAIVMAARYDRARAQLWLSERRNSIDATERATIERFLSQIDAAPPASPVSWTPDDPATSPTTSE
ncbi:MAG: hypothetical protein ACFB9N_15100 [Geitlerinemataceae cyanobacterium]